MVPASASPGRRCSRVQLEIPAAAAVLSARARHTTRVSPGSARLPSATVPTRNTPYSKAWPKAMARLPGRVQGVVVQITTLAPASSGRDGLITGKRTLTVVET